MGASVYPEGSARASNPRGRWSADVFRIGKTACGLIVLCLVVVSSTGAAGPSVDARWRLAAPPSETSLGELSLTVTVEPGWHLNANDPDRPYLVPTTLDVAPSAGTTIRSIKYPEPVVRALGFAAGTTLRLYEGTFTIAVRIAGMPDRFDATLGYQACNEETCLPPRTLAIPFDAKSARGAP